MRIEFKSVRDDLDRMIHKAASDGRTIKKIILSPEELRELEEEFNINIDRERKHQPHYRGILIEVENGEG